MPWENTMSGTRDPGAILVGQCRRAGTARERAESIQSKSMKEGAADCARAGSIGAAAVTATASSMAPRHRRVMLPGPTSPDGLESGAIPMATRESGLNTPRRSIAAHPALHKHTLNIIRTGCNLVLH